MHTASQTQPIILPASDVPQERSFNDDLLANEGDLRYAKDQFPKIVHILDHPELRIAFARYDDVANEAARRVKRLGLFAVLSGTLALLSASTEPLWHHLKYAGVMAVIFEFCGLFAAVVAGGSLWLGPWKSRWMEARFMTERIRQWHFQMLLRKGSEIEATIHHGQSQGQEQFKAMRRMWFDDFLHECKGKLGSKMDSLAGDSDFAGDWLHGEDPGFDSDSTVLPHVFEAYRRLRFMHQYDYATYKLSESKDRPFWQFLQWPQVRQESLLQGSVSLCFGLALLCSFGIILNSSFEIWPSMAPYFTSATLLIAVVGVALRTVQEGLGLSNDIERYRDYRGKVRRLMLCFDKTLDPQLRLRLMEEMELIVVDELRGFLRTHRGATFAL